MATILDEVRTTEGDKPFLSDPFLDWAEGEGVPITEDFGIHLPDLEVKPWARYGCNGGFAHLKGRGDWLSVFVLELAHGGNTEPQQHMFEEVVYCLSGNGSTQIELLDGTKHSFEWGRGSLFALPLNARYQHFNGSGTEPARLATVHNLPFLINLFRNEEFIFNTERDFSERLGPNGYF